MTTATTDPWAEVKRKAAAQRAADAEPAFAAEPEEATSEAPEASDPALAGMTAEELRRKRAMSAWVAEERRRKPGSMNKREKLIKGQREEALGLTDAPEGKPKFVKITSGIHVQTRGPVVIGKFFDPTQNPRGSDLPWWIFRLPGSDRLKWGTPRGEVLERVGAAQEIGGPTYGFGEAKGLARKLIAEANGELGS